MNSQCLNLYIPSCHLHLPHPIHHISISTPLVHCYTHSPTFYPTMPSLFTTPFSHLISYLAYFLLAKSYTIMSSLYSNPLHSVRVTDSKGHVMDCKACRNYSQLLQLLNTFMESHVIPNKVEQVEEALIYFINNTVWYTLLCCS